MENEQQIIGQYIIIGKLGAGTSAKVNLAENRITHEKFAIKILKKANLHARPNVYAKIQREIALMSLFEHPHIIKLYEVFESEQHLHIVLEYAENRELLDLLVQRRVLSEAEGIELFRQIIYALEYLHVHGICHRDLKPENILLDAHNNIKLADFGFAKWMKTGVENASCGSPHYAAPEVIRAQPYSGKLADVWSTGVILFAMLSGRLPFDDPKLRNLLQIIKKGEYEIPPTLNPVIQDLISKMLVVDPSKRITIEGIKQHPAFRINLPPEYILPTPLPLPTIDESIDPSKIQPQLLKVMKQIGYKDDQELINDLKEPGHTMAKVFHYMLTRQTDITSLPWETASHHVHIQRHRSAQINAENQGNQADDSANNEVKELQESNDDIVDRRPSKPSFGSVYSLAHKTDWAIGDTITISYEQEETISSIHASVAVIMTKIELLLDELGHEWFHPDDWTIISRALNRSNSNSLLTVDDNDKENNENDIAYTYIEFEAQIFDIDCVNLDIKMSIGSHKEFKIVMNKAHEMLNPLIPGDVIQPHPSLDLDDSKDELVPNLDS